MRAFWTAFPKVRENKRVKHEALPRVSGWCKTDFMSKTIKRVLFIAVVMSGLAGVSAAGMKCYSCNGTGWKGRFKCYTCSGTGER